MCSWPAGSWVASSRYGDLTLKLLNHRACSINLRPINSNIRSSMLAQGFGTCSFNDLATNRVGGFVRAVHLYLMVFGCLGVEYSLGRNMALLETKLAICVLMHRFEFCRQNAETPLQYKQRCGLASLQLSLYVVLSVFWLCL